MSNHRELKTYRTLGPIFGVLLSLKALAAAADSRCIFIRGDANHDRQITIADPVFILNWLYEQGPSPWNLDSADVNDDAQHTIADPMYLLGYLQQQAPPPPAPFPSEGCDCTPDDIEPCCSPPLTYPGALVVTNASPQPYLNSQIPPRWDSYESNVHDGEENRVDLRVWNNGCLHSETITWWRIIYSVSDTTPGFHKDAFSGGCVSLKATVDLAASFPLGDPCPYAPDTAPNSLLFQVEPGAGSVAFRFSNGSNVRDEVATHVSTADPFCMREYHLQTSKGARNVVTTVLDQRAAYTYTLSLTGEIFGDSCWHLVGIVVGRDFTIRQHFNRHNNQDLLNFERIQEKDFSVDISALECRWCP